MDKSNIPIFEITNPLTFDDDSGADAQTIIDSVGTVVDTNSGTVIYLTDKCS